MVRNGREADEPRTRQLRDANAFGAEGPPTVNCQLCVRVSRCVSTATFRRAAAAGRRCGYSPAQSCRVSGSNRARSSRRGSASPFRLAGTRGRRGPAGRQSARSTTLPAPGAGSAIRRKRRKTGNRWRGKHPGKRPRRPGRGCKSVATSCSVDHRRSGAKSRVTSRSAIRIDQLRCVGRAPEGQTQNLNSHQKVRPAVTRTVRGML